MVKTHPAGKLSLKTKVGFGICDLGGNLFFTIMGFYLLFFLTEILGLEAGLAGLALMVGKIWDAVSDPLVGAFSDRTKSRWGRRRPYMFIGSILLLLCMLLTFSNPGIDRQVPLFIWAAVVYCLLNTAYTLVNIPYGALTPELTPDFHERTVLNGYRMSFAVVGTLVGAAAVLPIVGLGGNPKSGWLLMGGVMGMIMLLTAFVTVFTVKEPVKERPAETRGIIKSYLSALRLKPFYTALIPWSCHITGINVIQASLLYYFKYIYNNEGAFQIALLMLLLGSLIFIPVWVTISKRIGKKMCYNLGMGIFAVSVMLFFIFGRPFGIVFSYVIMFMAGIGFATQYVMPYSLVPDIVEFDYADTGIRREGVFYGMWTFMSKLGQAFALALSGWVLRIFRYVPPSEAIPAPVQEESAIFGIRLLCGPIPVFFFIIGIVVLSFYPISAEVYKKIMARVEQRESGIKG